MAVKGGRIPPDGRPSQAPGVGKNAKRHDLERAATPGLHDSDLQQGDVQAMEEGQRIAPARTQQSGQAPAPSGGGGQQLARVEGGDVEIPDAIDFLAGENGDEFNMPQPQRQIDNSRAMTWMPLLRQLAAGPGASGLFVATMIDQARKMQQLGGQAATVIDLNAADEGIEAMLNEGVRSEFGEE